MPRLGEAGLTATCNVCGVEHWKPVVRGFTLNNADALCSECLNKLVRQFTWFERLCWRIFLRYKCRAPEAAIPKALGGQY